MAGRPARGALRGRVAIVTGARSGLGAATAAGLARSARRVHMVVRAASRPRPHARILRDVPGAELVLDECDVASLASVRAYAERFLAAARRCTCSCTTPACSPNGGARPPGHELAFATHVLGPPR